MMTGLLFLNDSTYQWRSVAKTSGYTGYEHINRNMRAKRAQLAATQNFGGYSGYLGAPYGTPLLPMYLGI